MSKVTPSCNLNDYKEVEGNYDDALVTGWVETYETDPYQYDPYFAQITVLPEHPDDLAIILPMKTIELRSRITPPNRTHDGDPDFCYGVEAVN